MYSPNLVCSTTFLSVHARKTTLTKGSIATIVIISSQTVTTLISSTLRQTNSSIVHINYWNFFLKWQMFLWYYVISWIYVSTCIQDNRNARTLNIFWKLVYFRCIFLCIFYMNTKRNYQTNAIHKKGKFIMCDYNYKN